MRNWNNRRWATRIAPATRERAGAHGARGPRPRTGGAPSLAHRVALVALAVAGGCGPGTSEVREPDAPVLLIGVDGLEWDVLLPLLARDELPTLAGLMRRGSYGLLATRRPTLSPLIWTSVATGKKPEAHGVLGFTFEEGGERRLYTSEHRRTKAFWNILGDHGVATDTIGWWLTFPVEPVLGTMVAQTNTKRTRADPLSKGTLRPGTARQVHPAELESEVLAIPERIEGELDGRLRAIFGDVARDGLSDEARRRWEACAWAFRADATYLEVARLVRAAGPAPLTSIYLGGTDVVGHRFWAARSPERFGLAPDEDEVRRFGAVVDAYYRFVDRELGELLAMWPEDTTVFLVSDHGMSDLRAEDGSVDLGASGGHYDGEPGVLIAAGASIRRMAGAPDPGAVSRDELEVVGDVLDICPTLLAFFGIPIGEDMPGHPIARLFEREELRAWQRPRIASHDDSVWLATRRVTGAQPENTAERIEQLEKLGYLEVE